MQWVLQDVFDDKIVHVLHSRQHYLVGGNGNLPDSAFNPSESIFMHYPYIMSDIYVGGSEVILAFT